MNMSKIQSTSWIRPHPELFLDVDGTFCKACSKISVIADHRPKDANLNRVGTVFGAPRVQQTFHGGLISLYA